jgi:C1A family cysteine protease
LIIPVKLSVSQVLSKDTTFLKTNSVYFIFGLIMYKKIKMVLYNENKIEQKDFKNFKYIDNNRYVYLKSYKKINKYQIKTNINNNNAVIIALKICGRDYYKKELITNKDLKKDYTNHVVVIIGYNDNDSTYIIKNSWGKKAHKNGIFKLKYDYKHIYPNSIYIIDKIKISKNFKKSLYIKK